MATADMFWRDRCLGVADADRWGYGWSLATRRKEVSPEQMKRGEEEFGRRMAAGQPGKPAPRA